DQIITSDPAQVLSIKKARAELKESQENQGYVN
ncbi:MAG: hypothetical protein ACJAV6_000550, partial [Candidatus Paceibacteria bacterium]